MISSSGVLVAGAGPVGLTLAMDLAWRGVEVVVVEVRADGELPAVKCNSVSSRSMEVYRRLGVAKKIRELLLIRWVGDRALQQPFHRGRYLRAEKCTNFLLMFATEPEHLVKHRGRWLPGIAAEHSP